MKLARSSALGVVGALGVLGMGGLAAAQEGLIVDPWEHAVSALLPKAASPATPHVGVASFPIEVPALPAVVPVGPPLRQGTADPKAPLAVGPVEALDAVDSWVEPSPGAASASRRTTAPSQWAWEIREIVDPWAKGPVASAAPDPLIVDPWSPRARSRY